MIFNKTSYFAIGIFLALVIPIGTIHELGHVAVCQYENLDWQLKFTSFGIATKCSGQPQNFTLFTVSGGLFAATLSLALFVFIPNKPAKIALASLAVIHVINALVETFLYNSYRQSPQIWSVILNTVMLGVFIIFLKKLNTEDRKLAKCLNDISLRKNS